MEACPCNQLVRQRPLYRYRPRLTCSGHYESTCPNGSALGVDGDNAKNSSESRGKVGTCRANGSLEWQRKVGKPRCSAPTHASHPLLSHVLREATVG